MTGVAPNVPHALRACSFFGTWWHHALQVLGLWRMKCAEKGRSLKSASELNLPYLTPRNNFAFAQLKRA